MSVSVVSLASTASTKILSEEPIQILRLKNDNSPVKHGFRSVLNTSYMSEASLDSQETVEIPEYLESLETFKSLEFNEDTAQALWQLYCQMLRDDPERCDLLKMAKYHITSTLSDAGQEGDGWAQEMRDVASANEWAILMITMRFEFLECLDDIIKTPSRGVERPASCITPSGELWRIIEAGPPKVNFKASPSTAVKPQPPAEIEGCRMFYRGGALRRLESVFKAGGSLNFGALRSASPTDFSDSTRGLYLTKQAEVAWKYAQ
ncbi:hypothetical protein MMC29_005163 [Sticta canariensis]|nr:hypothetical protein [Sticta canariensis]